MPHFKHLYRREACINDINFTEMSKKSHPYGATKFENFGIFGVFFGPEIPKYGPINMKFSTA